MDLALLIAFSILAICFLANYLRAKDKPVNELVPNCLLTRYPVVFAPGPRSFLYFLKYWNEIPHYLASHGYEVFALHLPWKNKSRRKSQLKKFLHSDSRKIHLFFDQGSATEITELLEEDSYDRIASLTWIRTEKDPEILPSSLKSLSHPIEEMIVPVKTSTSVMPSGLQNILWKMHLIFTSQDVKQKIEVRGYNLNPSLKTQILQRTQFLAERDLIQGDSTHTL